MTKLFDQLSSEEQRDWWLDKALDAYHQMGFVDATFLWLSHSHHAVLKVLAEENTYILKLTLPESSDQLDSEFAILEALSDAALDVARPLKQVHTDSVSAILLSYVSGEVRAVDDITLADVQRIGKFLATFHATNVNLQSEAKTLDWNGLFSDKGIYNPGDANMKVFSDEQLSVIEAVTQKVKTVMDELGQNEDEFGLIHGDLLLKNILFHNETIRALDFEYCGWGYYLYDLTPLLWQLKPQKNYSQLEQALWDGYISQRPLSARHRDLLETLIAGRQVASMRWVAANQQNPYVVGKVDMILEQRTLELSAFLETGVIQRS